jgi:DNA-binding transcriptional ArsR family regulator
MPSHVPPHFVYDQTMNAHPDIAVSRIAAAIGEPARARMLYSLVDGHARTSTELAVVAGVTPSTASIHLQKLRGTRLVTMVAQGKHRYYRLAGEDVADALEGLSVLAGVSLLKFAPSTPTTLRTARTCYDHLAGKLGVLLHDRLLERGWIAPTLGSKPMSYEVTMSGMKALGAAGIDAAAAATSRRKFAYPCLDWSERQPHLGGALGAACLTAALKSRWLVRDGDTRCLRVTSHGRRELKARFGIDSPVQN